MSFNKDYFFAVNTGMGKGGNSLWMYNDYPADNIASVFGTNAGGTVNTGFFSKAYADYGITARQGDIILVHSRANATGGANSATALMLTVPTTWDANGASVTCGLGTYGVS